MFRLASVNFRDQRVLVVEASSDSASRMADDVMLSGGVVVAVVDDLSDMLAAAESELLIDCVMVDAMTMGQAPIFVPEWLKSKNFRLVVVTSWDDWFLEEL